MGEEAALVGSRIRVDDQLVQHRLEKTPLHPIRYSHSSIGNPGSGLVRMSTGTCNDELFLVPESSGMSYFLLCAAFNSNLT